jgi:hypothetical protein
MNMLFEFYWEVWHYIKTPRRDEHWILQIIEMAEEIQPSWKPDREKLEALDMAYGRKARNEVRHENDLNTINAFVEAAKSDLINFVTIKDEKVQNLLSEISKQNS